MLFFLESLIYTMLSSTLYLGPCFVSVW